MQLAKKLFNALLLVSIFAIGLLWSPVSALAADYHVGPGQQYSNIGSVPWYTLKGGDTVYIHYQSTPYREKILISGTGSPSAWIKVTGVPDPSTGALPIISGNGATTGTNMHYRWTDSSGVNAIQHLGLIQIAIQAPTNGVDATLPAYIEISNLQLQDAGGGNGYKFTGENGTQGTYDDFAACIYIKSAQHIVFKNNIVTNCGNGFYDWEGGGYSGGATWFDGLTKDLKIIGNYFYSNGTPGNYNDHQLYTEAEDVLIEGNHFGTVRSGMFGSQVKDRSAGTVIRYNYIEQAPSSWDIDLVEPQEGWPVLGTSAKYKQSFVYGNIIVNTIAPDNSDVVHWNEDHYQAQGRAVPSDGRLFFYNNTVINKPNQANYPVNSVFNETQGGFDCPTYTMNGVVDLRNNIFYINGPGFYQFGYCGTYHFNFVNNWISPGYTVKSAGAVGQNTNISPTSNDPGFVNFAGGDYRLASNSSARGIGGALAPEVKSNNLGQDFTPNMQYLYRAKLSSRTDSGQGSNAGALSDSNGVVVTPTPTPTTSATPSVRLTGSGQIYTAGGTVTLTWVSSNATAVYLAGPYPTTNPPTTSAYTCAGTQVALNGSQVVSPTSTSWYIACAQGSAGQLVAIGTYQVYNYANTGNPTPTPTPTSVATPTPTPTVVSSGNFYIGQRVQTTANLNVRASASASATILGTQQIGSFGTIVGGPVNQGGFNWWQVDYDIGADGWSVEDFLAPSYTAPTPTPTATTQPTSVPTPTPTLVSGNSSSTLFPVGSWFYRNVSGFPLDAENTLVTTALNRVNWGWGSLRIDFSIDVLKADANTPVRSFTTTQDFWSPDCDSTPIPVPTDGNLEGESGYQCTGNGDCHLIVVDPSRNKLYEMWRANIVGGTFYGGCLAVWDTTKTYTVNGGGRGMQCTSADAAGYPITPLLVNADEVYDAINNNKPISHAIRFILPNERIRAGVLLYPATHTSGGALSGDVDMPPYGTLLRLRADYPVNNLPTAGARAVAKAMQTYGMYLADGGNIALTFQSDNHTTHKWSEVGVDTNSLTAIKPADFQMVDGGSRMADGAQCSRTPITSLPNPNTNPTPTPAQCVPPPIALGCTATLTNQASCQYSVSCPNVTPTPTPTPAGGTSTKFYVGQRVQTTSNLNVRSQANTTATSLGTESVGALGTITSVSVSAGGYSWWQVKYDDGLNGWSVEDYLVSYFVSQPTPTPTIGSTPVPTVVSGSLGIGSRVQLNSFANVRTSPGYASSISGPQAAGSAGTVTNGPINKDSINWWSVNYDNGVDGWTEEPYLSLISGGGSSTPNPTPVGTGPVGPAGYTFCSNEYQSCAFSGTKTVAYGLNGTFVYKTLVGGAVCINATFGDPLPGADKACFVSNSTSPTPTPIGTPMPTVITNPKPTPVPLFSVGDTVQTTVYLSVRSAAAGRYLGSQAPGSTGAVVGGPVYVNGAQWWKIDYASGKDGWSSQRYLVK